LHIEAGLYYNISIQRIVHPYSSTVILFSSFSLEEKGEMEDNKTTEDKLKEKDMSDSEDSEDEKCVVDALVEQIL
jgi:hypothetical protein